MNFICVGVQKAGTTTIHNILKSHKKLSLPDSKEARFIEVDELYSKGSEWFNKTYFPEVSEGNILGFINPNIQLDVSNIERIRDTFGHDVRIIIIIRNPVHRAISHYRMSLGRSIETEESFFKAIEKEPKRLASNRKHPGYFTSKAGQYEKDHFGYIFRSLYSDIIRESYNIFGKESVQVIRFEDFVKDPTSVLKSLCDFLSLDYQDLLLTNAHSNEAKAPRLKSLNKFLFDKSRRFRFSMVLPKDLVIYITRSLRRLNSKNSNKRPFLSDADYNKIFNKYFTADIEECENLLGISLEDYKEK